MKSLRLISLTTIILLICSLLFISCNKVNNEVPANNESETTKKIGPFWPYTFWSVHQEKSETNYPDIKLFTPNDFFVGLYNTNVDNYYIISDGFLDKNSYDVYRYNNKFVSPAYNMKLREPYVNIYHSIFYDSLFGSVSIQDSFICGGSISPISTQCNYNMIVSTNEIQPSETFYELLNEKNKSIKLTISSNLSGINLGDSLSYEPRDNLFRYMCYSKVLISEEINDNKYKSFVVFFMPHVSNVVDQEEIKEYELYIINVEVIEETINERTYTYYIQDSTKFLWNANKHFENGFDEEVKQRLDSLMPSLQNRQQKIINRFLSL